MHCEIYNMASGNGLCGTWDPASLSEQRTSRQVRYELSLRLAGDAPEARSFLQAQLDSGALCFFISELIVFEGRLHSFGRSFRQHGALYVESYRCCWRHLSDPIEPISVSKRASLGRGESLSDLAGRVYGSGRLWRYLARANGIVDPLNLSAGAELAIPSLEGTSFVQRSFSS
jgi:hypothetical protein